MTIWERFPILSRLLVAIIVIALVGLLVWGVWGIAYTQGWTTASPWDFDSLFGTTTTGRTILVPTVTPTPKPEATAKKTAKATTKPTAKPTTAPATHATYTRGEIIDVYVNGVKVQLVTFSYSGGYIPGDDPWYPPEKKKETDGSYGPAIYGKTPQEQTYNWLREACKSPHQITRLRVQMGLAKQPKTLAKENSASLELAQKSAKGYDKVVNETLSYFFRSLKGGRIEISTDWDLENYMEILDAPDDKWSVNLHGRLNHDDDTEKNKDVLLTFYTKKGKNFVSAERGFLNTVQDAKGTKKNFDRTAYVNMTEGGTWKWKAKGGKGGSPNNPTPTPNNPTPAPSATPTPRPAKDAKVRPTPPIGGGEVNPKNSADPKSKDHTESTKKPKSTKTPPKPTTKPTAVPTAKVRPTEVCPTAAPPVREDKYTPSPGGSHNVPTDKPDEDEADDDFDPGSI